MINDLKRLLLAECDSKVKSLKEESIQIDKDIRSLGDKETDLEKSKVNAFFDSRVAAFKKQYPLVSKVFRRSRYKLETQNLIATIRNECDVSINEINERRRKLDERSRKIPEEIDEVTQKARSLEAVDNYSDLGLSFEEAQELLSKNGLNIFDYPTSDILRLGPSEQTSNNLEYMKNAVKEDPFNIRYDVTNDFEMYYHFIENIPDSGIDEGRFKFKENKASILETMQKSLNGEIIIKPIQILEAIRYYFDDVLLGSGYVEPTKEALGMAIERIDMVIKRALELSEEDYKALENIYRPEEYDYYCHQTGIPGIEDKIFTEGLKMSNQTSDRTRFIGLMARKTTCLLSIAGYNNFYAGNGSGDEIAIVEIPKEEKRPIGSNFKDGRETYLLPEYVIGAISRKITRDSDGGPIEMAPPVLHMNTKQNRAKYRYLYTDNYDVYLPCPIENPEYQVTEERDYDR